MLTGRDIRETTTIKKDSKLHLYLVKEEWSRGNGQCPVCGGLHPDWNEWGVNVPFEKIGHEKDCLLVLAMKEAGMNPIIKDEE